MARWWTRDAHAARRPRLLARARIAAALRGWFAAEGFVEVEPACLQVSPGNETHLHALETRLERTDGSSKPLYLHTSPEFACKKLLAAGETRIYTFAPVFRNRERGRLHHPEFMMLEWYRANETYDAVMADCAQMLRIAAETAGTEEFHNRTATCDALITPDTLTVADAIAGRFGIDLLATVASGVDASASPEPDPGALAAAARAAGISFNSEETWSDLFSRMIVALEPGLGTPRATFLTRYPASEAALARPSPDDPRVAERFELYVAGVELANGFGELNDGGIQRMRLEQQMAEREIRYGDRYPIDESFIAAVDRMPPAAGCALGFDRLVMLATGADRIDDVIWTPLCDGT